MLDEPNSNLDYEGEAALSRTILRAKEKKITTVIISHRMTLMSVVDKVLVIKEGLVAAYGPRDQVLAQMGMSAPAKPAAEAAANGASEPVGFKREKKAEEKAKFSFQMKDSTAKPVNPDDEDKPT